MTSDSTHTSAEPTASGRPTRRRATRKAAAPGPVGTAGPAPETDAAPEIPGSPSGDAASGDAAPAASVDAGAPGPDTPVAPAAPATPAASADAAPGTDAPGAAASGADASGADAPAPAAEEAPAPRRATRSRRATSATAADAAPEAGTPPKRATRSRAKAAPAPQEVDPDAAPALDVLAELAPLTRPRRSRSGRTAAPVAAETVAPEGAAAPLPAPGVTAPAAAEDELPATGPDVEQADAEQADARQPAADQPAERTRVDAPAERAAAPQPAEDEVTAGGGAAPSAAPDESTVGPRLATTALLFQPPEPTAARPRRRRVVAQAGPPQFVVPEVISPEPAAVAGRPAAAEPAAAQPAAAEPAAPSVREAEPSAQPAAEVPAAGPEPRRRSRRATRSTAAPVAPAEAPAGAESGDSAAPAEPAAATVTAGAVEPAAPRRSSRRRGGRGAGVVEEALAADLAAGADAPATDAPTTEAAGTDALDVAALDTELVDSPPDDVLVDDADTDDDSPEDADDTSGGAPRRRRRRGGRGRRSRAGGDSDRAPSADDAEGDDDEDEDEETPAGDVSDEDAADEGDTTADGEESSGSSRRRRRRRRSGRGTEGAEADADVAPAVARVRAPRTASDEVTALRGSTRLEAKRQRRREGRDAGRRRQIITEAEFLARRESVDRTMVVREVDGRTQIAVLEDGVLVEHYVSRQAQLSMAGNVYLGRVQNVLPSMEAAFIDVGKGRNAVLYAGEVNWDAAGLEGQPRRIEQALKSGDSVLVQVTKDPIGHKGARLTSQITLAGRYLVYVPAGGMTGISRKLPENERARLKRILREIIPDSAGVIVRTAAEGASEEELRADILRLQEQWAAIEKKAKTASAPALLQGEPDMAIRVVRDIFNDDFASLVVQGDEAWQTISGYIGALAPDLAQKVTRWTGQGDVFAAHRVDEQLAKGMDRKVWLPSGGSLVIDRTEAMTVVDVNTGKFTGSGGTLEETVTRNNLEAAEEIVRQLRLRDIGGIIVIDFIDMVLELNRDLVLRRLVECLGRDRTKHQVAEVTSLGLVQMTRKRVGQGLVEAFSETCEHCNGRGFIVHTDPIERAPGQGQPAQVQSPQPPVGGGEDPKRARRKRGGAKEQGPAVPSGLPMVPVLPQAREAVKATLATIAAAAAHAHEHDHNGQPGRVPAPARAAEAAGTTAGAPADPDAGPSGGEAPRDGGHHPDATAAVTEALLALRAAQPVPDPDVPVDVHPEPGEDVASVLEEEAEVADVAAALEGDDSLADVAPPDEEVLALEPLADAVVADAASDLDADVEPLLDGDGDGGGDGTAPDAADPGEDVAGEQTLELVPVAPEVFEDTGADPVPAGDPVPATDRADDDAPGDAPEQARDDASPDDLGDLAE